MASSATLLILPATRPPDAESDGLQATDALLTQRLEDLRLAERVALALRATGYGALRTLEVTANSRIVRLVGRVPSYHLKQIAQETALAVPGTHEVHNGLDVVRPN